MALSGWRVALELAREKGAAPILEQEFTVTAEMLRTTSRKWPATAFKAGDHGLKAASCTLATAVTCSKLPKSIQHLD
jgi:hypothetical protein